MKKFFSIIFIALLLSVSAFSQTATPDEKAEAIVKKAVEKLGGQNYLQAKSIASSGTFTMINGGQQDFPRTFVDVLVFPDKERTEFKQGGLKTVQTNAGASGWLYDGAEQSVKAQTKNQIEDFRRGVRTSLDNLLRGHWRTEGASLSYAGRRQAGVGRRNDVVKITYPDGFKVEFEFSDDGMPVKAVYSKTSDNGDELKEEDRYAQFVEFQGIYAPLIVDHYINGNQTSRINYLKIEFNRNVPDSIFIQPADAKSLKKDLKF